MANPTSIPPAPLQGHLKPYLSLPLSPTDYPLNQLRHAIRLAMNHGLSAAQILTTTQEELVNIVDYPQSEEAPIAAD